MSLALRKLLKGTTKRPWVAFDSGDDRPVLAIMKGPRPVDRRGPGDPYVRWPEVVAWTGFDGAHVPKAQRRANLHLVVAAVNALPQLLDAIDAMADALDLADGIFATDIGTDTPKEWHAAMRKVQRARAKLP